MWFLKNFPEAELIAGVATAGIPWGAMIADQLKLPYVYVRPKPKEHGLGNQIEGFYIQGQKTVVIEDLVSTGGSSLLVVEVLRNAGLTVEGMVSIFTYDFPVAASAFEKAGIKYFSLTDYPSLIELAGEKEIVSPNELDIRVGEQDNGHHHAETRGYQDRNDDRPRQRAPGQHRVERARDCRTGFAPPGPQTRPHSLDLHHRRASEDDERDHRPSSRPTPTATTTEKGTSAANRYRPCMNGVVPLVR